MAKQTKGTNTRNGKNRALLIGFCIVIFLIMAGIFSSFSKVNDNTDTVSWSLDESGLLSFSGRTLPAVKVSPLEETVNYTLEKISYLSDDTMVYGLLRLPKEVQTPPVVIVLPAATVTKEGDSAMADALCSFGYASLTLDERGNGGETQGVSPMDLQTGYTAYRNREMPPNMHRSTMCSSPMTTFKPGKIWMGMLSRCWVRAWAVVSRSSLRESSRASRVHLLSAPALTVSMPGTIRTSSGLLLRSNLRPICRSCPHDHWSCSTSPTTRSSLSLMGRPSMTRPASQNRGTSITGPFMESTARPMQRICTQI